MNKSWLVLLLLAILFVCFMCSADVVEAKRGGRIRRAIKRILGRKKRRGTGVNRALKAAKKAQKKAKKLAKKLKKLKKPTPTTVVQKCQATGDPHYITFTGKKYDFYGTGDYVLARSTDGKFVAHSRTGKWGKVSVNTGIAVKVDRAGVIEYNVNTDKFYLDKKVLNLETGKKILIGEQGGYAERFKANGLIVSSSNGAKLTAEWSRAESNVKSLGSAGAIHVYLDSPKEVTWTKGLCVTQDATKQQAIGLMHDHKPRKIVKRTIPKPTAEQKQKARDLCIKAGIPEKKKRLLASCIVDVIVSGKTEGKHIAKTIAKLRKDEKKKRKKWAKKWAKKALKKYRKKKAALIKKEKAAEKEAKKDLEKAKRRAKRAAKKGGKKSKKVSVSSRTVSKLRKEVARLLKLKKKLGKKWNPRKHLSKLVKRVLRRLKLKTARCPRKVRINKVLIAQLKKLARC
ncbi:hypothetical protein ABK040_003113 [Willaertia magna]